MRRLRVKWAVRGILAGMVAILGGVGASLALAWPQANRNPVFAHRLAPYDGQLTGRAALATAVKAIADGSALAESDMLARQALRQDANAVAAVVTLGMNAEARGEIAAARHFFNYAQSLTRRDRRIQLWAIEDAVRRNDVAGAIQQYDITLRTMPQLGEILYPILIQSSGNQEIRSYLVQSLAQAPMWRDDFVEYASKNKSVDPNAAVILLAALAAVQVPVAAEAKNGVLNSLVSIGKLEAAWKYYRIFYPGSSRSRSRDPEFSRGGDVPSPFDWVPVGNDHITTGISGGIFDFAVSASVGGRLLQQLQLLPPGDYQLTGKSNGIDQSPKSRPYWQLSCSDGKEIGRISLSNSSERQGQFSGKFTVPAGCPVQMLVLIARPSEAIGGSTGQITKVQLVPVQG